MDNWGMDSTLAGIVTRLAVHKGRWPAVSDASGVPISTLRKIAQGHIKNPRIETVDNLRRGLDSVESEDSPGPQ
jgi:predicted transcriptional regulator